MKVMITGANGHFGKLLARRLRAEFPGIEIVGVDVKHEPEVHEEMKFRTGDTRKKRIEDIFKVEGKIDMVVHLAFESGHQRKISSDELMLTNVYGTAHMLELAEKYGVSKFIYPSSTIVYGARLDNPAAIKENHPLLGNRDVPPIRDRVEADLICQTFARGHTNMDVIILRLVPIWRSGGRGILTLYMQGDFVPVLLGFDPMYQILFDSEVLEALMLAIRNPDARGMYNIRGRIFEPLSQVVRGLGKIPVPLPEFLVHIQGRALWADNLKFDHNYIKYSFAVDGSRAKEELGYDPLKV